LIPVYEHFVSSSNSLESVSLIAGDNFSYHYHTKILDILRPWSAYFNLSPSSSRVVDSDELYDVHHFLMLLSNTERNIAFVHEHRSELDQAENHCHLAVSYAKLYEGEEEVRVALLCGALKLFADIRCSQNNFADAVTYDEENYNCAAIAYNPVHPEVQSAASTLIECLILIHDYDKAEIFAQMTLDSLKDPANGVNQRSEAVAKGHYDLALCINEQNGNLIKAEKLIRESLRIRLLVLHKDHGLVGHSIMLLARNLQLQLKLGSETKELFERFLSISLKHCGPDGTDTATANELLGRFYFALADTQPISERKVHLPLSISSFQEAHRICIKLFGPDDRRTLSNVTYLSTVSDLLRREVIRDKVNPDR
jgi:tetratricopeptide (TPR) repeat protein